MIERTFLHRTWGFYIK